MNYGTVNGRLIIAPLTISSKYTTPEGVVIGAWHTLTDDERAEYGWYPCEIINEGYDPLTQTRTDLPELSFNESKKLITAKYTITNKLVDEIKDDFLEQLSSVRYEKEVGGIVYEGISQSTKRDKRLELADKVKFMSTSTEPTMWKSDGGWNELSYDQIKALSDAVGLHVDNCFKAENEVFKIIKASTKAKLIEMNIPDLFEQELAKASGVVEEPVEVE